MLLNLNWRKTCLMLVILIAASLCFQSYPAAYAQEESTNSVVKDDYKEELERLVRESQKALEANQTRIKDFLSKATESLKSPEEVQVAVKNYLSNIETMLADFENDGELMTKARELSVEYRERAKRLDRLSKSDSNFADEYKEMAKTYRELDERIINLQASLRAARTSGMASMTALAKQETYLVEVVRQGQAIAAVNALNEVTRSFENSMANCNALVKKLDESVKTAPVGR